jgi:broad-specificity NMP kinase
VTKNLVIIICGPSGNGKTTLTDALAKEIGAIPLHLDDLFFGHHYRNYDNPLMIAKAAGIIARKVADFEKKPVIGDFLFFNRELRDAFKPDYKILLDTKANPLGGMNTEDFDYVVTERDAENVAKKISQVLNNF